MCKNRSLYSKVWSFEKKCTLAQIKIQNSSLKKTTPSLGTENGIESTDSCKISFAKIQMDSVLQPFMNACQFKNKYHA